MLELTEQDKRYIIYALAEYMVRNNIVSLEDIPDSVYKDMVAGNVIQDDDGNVINANPDYDYYKAEFNKVGSITQDEFRQLIAKYPDLYNSLVEKIDRTRFVNEAKDFGLQIAGGVSGVAVSFGQIGEPFLKPLETVEALYDFVQTEDKLLAIQMAVAMDLQNRQELLELHHKNNDTFGIALETSRNTADALLVLTSIHKAPKEIVTLIPTLKNAGSVIFKGVKYTYSEGKIVAHKIPSPNADVNTNVPASQNLPNVYGDGDLGNVYDRQRQQVIKSEPNYQNIRYGHNVYDESFRTVAADREGQKVIQAMEGVVSSKYSQTVNIMLHQDGTVSVGLSGNLGSSKTLARIQATQQALDKKYGAGKYIVSADTLNGTQGLKKVGGSNEVGTCAEPKCSVAAKDNPSPVTGFAIMWRGKDNNPFQSNKMKPNSVV